MLDQWAAVLGAIVDAPRAWSTAAEVAACLEWSEDDAKIVIDDLALNGMLDPWGPAWTLSPLAAEGLNVCLIGDGLSSRLRWHRGEPPRGPAPRRQPPGDDPAAEVPDPAPGPAERAELAESAGRWTPRGPLDVDRLPRPAVILTGCRSVWDEAPGRVAGRRPRGKGDRKPFSCSACKGAKLKPSEYCARCHRWGLDGLVAAHRRAAERAAREAV